MVGDLFITSLMIFPFILVVGYLVQILLWGRKSGSFTTIINVLAFIGVFFHEISHYILSVLTGVPAGPIRVRLRDEETGRIAPHGAVGQPRGHQKTLLQAVLVSFGPVLLGAWIFYIALKVAFNSLSDPLFRIIAGFLALSVLIASTPSPQDFHLIREGFSHDPRHAIYQLILLTISILLSLGVVILFNITLPIEFLYYGLIILWYVTLKYSLLTIRWGLAKIRARFRKEKSGSQFRRISRRRYKSSKFK
jgi:hypothetical protein